jgi:hypothetical protein
VNGRSTANKNSSGWNDLRYGKKILKEGLKVTAMGLSDNTSGVMIRPEF